MDYEWWDRFKAAVAEDGRSLRQLSIDAGVGENYLQQQLKKHPPGVSVDYFLRVLRALGRDPALHIIAGFKIDPDRDELVRLFEGWSASEVRQALDAFRAFRASAPMPSPRA